MPDEGGARPRQAFVLYVGVRLEHGVSESILDVVGRGLRPGDDEGMCVWQDEQDPGVLRVSTDVLSVDHDAAVAAGRLLSSEVLRVADAPAVVEEVVAMTETGRTIWRP